MSSSRTIAVVVSPLLPWPPATGGQKRTLRLLEAMEAAGATPHLLTPDPAPEAAQALRDRGWTVEVAAAPHPTPAQRVGQHLARLPSPRLEDVVRRLAALRATAPAFVQLEHVMSASSLPTDRGIPAVVSTHNVDSEMLATVARGKRRLRPAWARAWNLAQSTAVTERRMARRADAVLCVSEHDAEYFAGLGAATVLAPNGVDDDAFAVGAAPEGAERVLFFGRLDYAPNDLGLRRFLDEVWPQVARERPAAQLRVVGAGLGAEAAAAVARSTRVEAVGAVEDIMAELAACTVVSVPIWQGGGTRLKVLEALGAGRAVAGTTLGVSGIGVRPGVHAEVAESSRDLAAATVRLLADPAAARELAAHGRALAEGFRWSATTAPAVELYARWVAASRREP